MVSRFKLARLKQQDRGGAGKTWERVDARLDTDLSELF